MPWSTETPAAILTATTGREGGLTITSTGSIRTRAGSARVCTFGISESAFEGASGEFEKDRTITDPNSGCRQENIAYHIADGVSGVRAINIESYEVSGAYPLNFSCVDGMKPDKEWPMILLSSSGFSKDVTQGLEPDVSYKDPFVLHLPHHGKWLMVLSRERAKSIDSDYSGPSKALGDIVAYLSNSPYFDDADELVGPLWLASGLRAYPDDLHARYWLSVPTAAVVHGRLYLYFVAEPSTLDSTGFIDPSPGTHVHARSAIACRRIPLDRLLEAANDPAMTDESLWEADPNFGRYVVPGVDLGEIRLWLAGNRRRGHVRSFTTCFDLTTVVDPDCLACGPGDFAFFFSANCLGDSCDVAAVAPGYGFGIWRASPLERGVALTDDDTGVTLTSEEGVDFVMHAVWDAADTVVASDDLVAESTDPSAIYLDPDAVLQLDGGVRVMCGKFNAAANEVIDWVMFTATESDACRPAEDAWRFEAEDGPYGDQRQEWFTTIIDRRTLDDIAKKNAFDPDLPAGTRILATPADIERESSRRRTLIRAPAEPPCACNSPVPRG